MLFSCGYTISQIPKISFSLSSNLKSGLLDVLVFLKLNANSHISFQDIHSTPIFFVPLHVFLYQMKFLCPWNCQCHQFSGMPCQIVAICRHFASSQKMFYRFLLLATQSPFTTFGKSSWSFPCFCFRHLLQHSHHWGSPFCVRLCLSHILLDPVFVIFRFAFSFPCILLSVYPPLFFNLTFIAFHIGFHSFSILSPSSKMQSSPKSITVPTAGIDVIALPLVKLAFFSNYLFHAAFLHLLIDFIICCT